MDPNLSVRFTVILEKNGAPVLDYQLAYLLRAIKRHGSLLAAARALGIPYSRAWDTLSRAERILGYKLIETWRGGAKRGGAKLTPEAERLLTIYEEAESRLEKCVGPQAPRIFSKEGPDLIVAYSHDLLLELILEKIKEESLRVEAVCMGSGLSLAMLSLGEADVACMHLLDPESGEYNLPYLRRYWLDDARLIGGYEREIVLALREGLDYSDPLQALTDALKGELRIINRNRGSGTRVLIDYLLRTLGEKMDRDPRSVAGYEREVYTHTEAAREVALGRADIALVLRSAAESYGLKFLHVTWEKYECYTREEKLDLDQIRKLKGILGSEWLRKLMNSIPGYRPLSPRHPIAVHR